MSRVFQVIRLLPLMSNWIFLREIGNNSNNTYVKLQKYAFECRYQSLSHIMMSHLLPEKKDCLIKF